MGLEQARHYEAMGIKAGLLADGVFFPKELLKELTQYSINGTGLFNYNDTLSAPNEICVHFDKNNQWRIEVRQKNSQQTTPFQLSQKSDDFLLIDSLTKQEFEVTFPALPIFMNKLTSTGRKMREVMTPMGSDYLRLYPDMQCDHATNLHERCRFCHSSYKKPLIHDEQIFDDIHETLLEAKKEMKINGIFMSTGAFDNDIRTRFYEKIIRIIRTVSPTCEIVFALAPQLNSNHIQSLYDAGNPNIMLSYNLECYDDKRWDMSSESCIGIAKAKKGRKYYFDAYRLATEIGGRGNHKSNFVIGLESLDSMKSGIETLGDIGVSSTGTVFYYTPGSIWSQKKKERPEFTPCVDDFNNANTRRDYVLMAYILMAEAVKKYDLHFPWSVISRISGLEWDALTYLGQTKEK